MVVCKDYCSRRPGRRLVVVRAAPGGGGWTAAVLAVLEAGGVAVVAVPQVHWMEGAVLDLVAIGAAARRAGAALVIDATQVRTSAVHGGNGRTARVNWARIPR